MRPVAAEHVVALVACERFEGAVGAHEARAGLEHVGGDHGERQLLHRLTEHLQPAHLSG